MNSPGERFALMGPGPGAYLLWLSGRLPQRSTHLALSARASEGSISCHARVGEPYPAKAFRVVYALPQPYKRLQKPLERGRRHR